MAFKMKGHALPGIKQRKAGGYPKKSPLPSHTPSHIVDETPGETTKKEVLERNLPPKRVELEVDPIIKEETDVKPTMEELREDWMEKKGNTDRWKGPLHEEIRLKQKPGALTKKSPYLVDEVDNSGEVDKNKEAYKQFTSKVMAANPQFEEVENPYYDESKGGDRMTSQPILDWENPAYDDIRDKFAYNPDTDYSKIETK